MKNFALGFASGVAALVLCLWLTKPFLVPVLSASTSPSPSSTGSLISDQWQWVADNRLSPSWRVQWNFICKKTGRIDDLTVWEPPEDNRDNSHFRLWVRGADYGEYLSLEQAKRAGELQIVKKNFVCD